VTPDGRQLLVPTLYVNPTPSSSWTPSYSDGGGDLPNTGRFLPGLVMYELEEEIPGDSEIIWLGSPLDSTRVSRSYPSSVILDPQDELAIVTMEASDVVMAVSLAHGRAPEHGEGGLRRGASRGGRGPRGGFGLVTGQLGAVAAWVDHTRAINPPGVDPTLRGCSAETWAAPTATSRSTTTPTAGATRSWATSRSPPRPSAVSQRTVRTSTTGERRP
jgi:hypothetical protein